MPFILKPDTPDQHLEKKLIAEAPGILRWMIEGCLDWQNNGLIRPETVRAATDDYFADQDLLGQWLADCCDQRADIWDTSGNLFDSWTDYAVKAGEKPGTKKAFGQALGKKGFQRAKSGARRYLGLRVKPEPMREDET